MHRSDTIARLPSRFHHTRCRVFSIDASSLLKARDVNKQPDWRITSLLFSLLTTSQRACLNQQVGAAFEGSSLPTQVLNGKLERFAEPISKGHIVSEKTRTKLLAFICTLLLVLDECNTAWPRIST